jgi:hypothetical protein
MRTRLLLGLVGVAAAAYGAWSLLHEDRDNWADLVDTGVWLGAGVVLHDFVVVPLTLAAGWLVTRLLPPGRRTPVAVGLVVLGTLSLLAVPVLGGWGANADNPTILDRDYVLGWLVVAGVTTVVVLATMVTKVRRSGGPGARRR